ncbi:Leucine Rich Repeat family protein [Trichomonas vaginalis G3]|uniref:Leucine Rich Repeat family protein n=1 Tax=Trichomonas vaginalis (strain ATCC PRA-98 / G3) TaxID=412133 RepID=A2F673_TRIV3|nr:uncharacterized protein TVAGG3_0660410 [Trichomonas vaginalis G3]EAX99590.1 Leucine Rich Repeat family protein [Trichomonas vaginalis G3]KAI5506459.1 axoneme assembly [Trichomonas vaginalis G3]|eukprot:XP_001312520.1 hypothetical protein [Trichomonas vaginalis G3]
MEANKLPELSSIAFDSSEVADLSAQNINTFSSIENLLPRTDISIIKIRSNNVQKFDKEFFNKHKRIKYLDVSDNEIQDLMGIELLEDLVLLDCSKNFIKRLSNLEKCVSLKRLLISSNEITNVFLKSAIPKLVVLDLHKNQLKKIDFGKYFPLVSELYCDNCQLTSLNGLQEFASLKHFTAKGNMIYDVDNIASNTLADLDLTGNKVSKLSFISKFPNLVFINVSQNPITDKSLEGVKQCPAIRAFRCSNTDITRISPFLMLVPNIELLELEKTKINDYIDVITFVKKSKKLRLLSLRFTPLTNSLYTFKDNEMSKKWNSLEEYQNERGVNEELQKYRQGILDAGQLIEILDTIIVTDQEVLNGNYEYEESLHENASDEFENEEEDQIYKPLPLQPISTNFSEVETTEFSTQTENQQLHISKVSNSYEIQLKQTQLSSHNDVLMKIDPKPKINLSLSQPGSFEVAKPDVKLSIKADNLADVQPKQKPKFDFYSQSLFAVVPIPKKEERVVCINMSGCSPLISIEPKVKKLSQKTQQVFSSSPQKKQLSNKKSAIFEQKPANKPVLTVKSNQIFEINKKVKLSKTSTQIFTQNAKRKTNMLRHFEVLYDKKISKPQISFNAVSYEINQQEDPKIDISKIDIEKRDRIIRKLMQKNEELQAKISELSVDKGSDFKRQIEEYARKIKHLKQSQEKHLIEIGILRERTRSQSIEISKLLDKIPSNDTQSMSLIEKMFNAVESQNQFLVRKVSAIKPQVVENEDKSILMVIDNLLKQNRTLHNEIIKSTLQHDESSVTESSEISLSPKKTHHKKKNIDSRVIARQWQSQSQYSSSAASEIEESESTSYSYLPSEYVLRKPSKHRSHREHDRNPFGLSGDAPLWSPDRYQKRKTEGNPSYSISSYV